MQKIDHALALAQLGFRIFPLTPLSKVPPKDFAWKAEATADPDKIRKWWDAEPGYNIGVATGAGTIVVDADTKDGKPGLASLAMLDAMDLPDSFRVATPSGGRHVYLKTGQKHRNRVNSIDGFEGIDLRSDGGYVLGPGSELPNGKYETISANPVEPSPRWFDDLLLRAAPKHTAKSEQPLVELDLPGNVKRAIDYLTNMAPEAIQGAGGDNATFEVAAACRDFGLSQDKVLDVMLEHWNEQKASPPWMPDDLQVKVENAFTYGTGGWGARSALAEFGPLDIDVGEPPARRAEPGIAVSETPAAPGKKSAKVLKTLDYAHMLAMPEPSWLIEGVAMQKSGVLMFGKSNAFKSFLAIDMGLAVATGRQWHGHDVQKAKVLFVATEGAVGVGRKRIPGWYAHHDVPAEQRGSAWLYPQEISLDNKEHVDILVATILHLDVKLLVLDIFGGTMDGTEVEDTTARAWNKSQQRIIRDTGATVLTVAHTGWQDDTRARMHTHFWGSFDSRLKVEGDKDKMVTVLSIERHKDADSRGEFGFRLEPTHGTLVPVFDETIAKSSQSGLPTSLKTALKALEKALADDGRVVDEVGMPFIRVAPFDAWRQCCYDYGISNSPKDAARRQAFSRAVRELEQRKLIGRFRDYVWDAEDEKSA